LYPFHGRAAAAAAAALTLNRQVAKQITGRNQIYLQIICSKRLLKNYALLDLVDLKLPASITALFFITFSGMIHS